MGRGTWLAAAEGAGGGLLVGELNELLSHAHTWYSARSTSSSACLPRPACASATTHLRHRGVGVEPN